MNMNRMRKCNDEVYQLAKDQALVKKLKNKRFRPFCLCLPGVMFVTRGSKNSLFSVFVEYKEKKINKRVPLVLTYHPSLEKISGIVRHHWKEI